MDKAMVRQEKAVIPAYEIKEADMQTIDLSGAWRYREDRGAEYQFTGERLPDSVFMLPGSTCANRIGVRQEYYSGFSKEAVRAPKERYEYIAPLWLQRDIEVPEELAGKSVRLYLERVNIASDLWIDDRKIGRQTTELSAPHIYNLTGKLSAGRHRLTLRIDNRNLLSLGDMASGYSVDTQGYWNGIIGRIELQYEEIFHIEDIQVYPDERGIGIKMVESSDVYSPSVQRSACVELYVTAPDGRTMEKKRFVISLHSSRQVSHFRYDFGDISFWSEFNPALYTLHVKYSCGDISDEKSVRFGMRAVRTEGRHILLNGRRISLRGTTDCAIYPITGYPPMETAAWEKNLRTIKSYGLNHVRFHAWCPPECAFAVADELGLYLSVEMPLWLNQDISDMEVGDDAAHRQYFLQEALTISRTYGNHPSFLMFSNGNENMGDFELLEDITTCVKACDSRRLYTLTTNFDHPIQPCEDYLCAFEADGRRVRLQTLQDDVAESTSLDYAETVENMSVPVVSFEVGQYCVYPDVDAAESYTGNMLPVNLDAIRKHMKEKGVYHRLRDYINASGNLAVKLYKEEIEAALRTKDMGGFELLSLCDYTGQSTATVGILDVQFRSKGLITPEEFRQFCGQVVPLFRAKRIFTNDEVLEAELGLYDFGRERITEPEYSLTIKAGDRMFYACRTKDTKIRVPLSEIRESTQLTVTLEVAGHENRWRIFVFAAGQDDAGQMRYIRTRQELEEIIRTGGRGIVTGECFENPVKCSFIPVFWSPVHFPSQKSCGAIIDDGHPIFKGFPTGKYPDYQWKQLLENAVGENLARFSKGVSGGRASSLSDGMAWQPDDGGILSVMIEMVPNFVDNTWYSPLFEARIGKAELVFCGFDLDGEYPEARQLKRSIENYITAKEYEM